jgi:hypothetical protein
MSVESLTLTSKCRMLQAPPPGPGILPRRGEPGYVPSEVKYLDFRHFGSAVRVVASFISDGRSFFFFFSFNQNWLKTLN